MKPKICLNIEFKNFLGGKMYENIGTGLLSSYKNQKRIFEQLGIDYTEDSGDKEYNILQVNLMGPKTFYLIKRDHWRGKKIVSYAHVTPEDFRDVFWFNKLLLPFMKRFLVYMHNQCDTVICPSQYTRDLMLAHGVKTPLVPLSNAVDTRKYHFDEQKRKTGREKFNLKNITVFSVGLVLPRKSPSTFINMAEKFKDINFIWFGKIYSGALVKKLPKKMPENLQFTGYVDDIIEAFSAGDIFVFPSHEENEGMAILEAAATEKPLIVRDIPVYKGWLMHEKNCFKAENQNEFEKYVDILKKDKILRDKMGAEALALANRNNLESVGKRLLEIYSGLLSG